MTDAAPSPAAEDAMKRRIPSDPMAVWFDRAKNAEATVERQAQEIAELREELGLRDYTQEIRAEISAELDAALRRVEALREALLLVLDQVDYTVGACGLTSMVGACLPTQIIERARAALASPAETKGTK